MFFKIIYFIAQHILRLFFSVSFKPRITGRENIIKNGGFVLSCNHKSNFDPAIIGAFVPRQIQYLAKKELFANKLFGWFLKGVGVIPITRETAEIGTLKTVIRLLRNEGAIAVFPEGTRKNKDLEEVKSGAVLFAIKGQVPILPVLITGDYKPFGGLKLTFGEPVYYTKYYKEKVSQQQLHGLSKALMEHIYSLSDIRDDISNENTVS